MNLIHKHRKPKKQRDWDEVELRVLMGFHRTSVTTKELLETFDRSESSIRRKACEQGIVLKEV